MRFTDEQVFPLLSALEFYADPETYFAIAMIPDPPNGEFMDDFTETEDLGWKPGKLARETLEKFYDGLPSGADQLQPPPPSS